MLTCVGRCGLPLCQLCQEDGGLHQAECEALLANSQTFKLTSKEEAIKTYPTVTILRLLLSGEN